MSDVHLLHRSSLAVRLATVCVLAASFALQGGAEESPTDRAVRAMRETSNLEASFVQRFTPKGFRHEQVERGKVVFGVLPRMRWEYADPEPKTFVFDGTTSWFYVPDDEQLTIHTLSRDELASLPLVLLGDAAAVSTHYRVRVEKNEPEVILVLDPVTDGAMLRSITIVVSSADGWVERLSWEDREGNRTVFELTGQKPNRAKDETFILDPPVGTDVIRN